MNPLKLDELQFRRALPRILHLLVAVFALSCTGAWGGDVKPLSALARIGPWPAISALIGYRGRLWFANSVKYANHNSADVYSYDPQSGDVRYERHLFSQDDTAAWREWWRHRERQRDRAGACEPRFSRSALVPVPGGFFMTGDPQGEPDEAPRAVTLKPFRMMRLEVTNGEFRRFVASTGHVTDPQRNRTGYVWTDRWRPVRGASWTRPQGAKSRRRALDSHEG